MYFGMSDEQQELASTVRSLLAKRADSPAVRSAMDSADGYDVGLWRTLCEQIGAAALAVPEEYGGAGFTLFETGVVLTELGYSLAPSPLLASVVAAEALRASGDDGLGKELLPRIAAGEVATLAWEGITRGPDVATGDGSSVLGHERRGVGGPAVTTSDGSALTGNVENVLFGDRAAIVLVVAETPEGLGLFHVDRSHVQVTWTPAMDPTTRLATLNFDGTLAQRIGGDATATLERVHRVGTVAGACLQLGVAQRGLDMTVAYTKERVQFGRPIGGFQALKHRMADMLVEVEMSRSAAWAATYAVANDAEDAGTLTAAAASYCTEALDHVAAETIQLHGGIAITWEHDAHLLFKRAHALRQLFGLPHEHRATIDL
jgi:alkylation response protein AidB-like acyl-CoA dehydrogenase